MHLLPDQLVFGVAPAMLVDCARQIHQRNHRDERHAFGIDAFCEALGAPISEAGPVLEAMLSAGYFEQVHGEPGHYIATKKLGQLALASISLGISRAEADMLLAQIVEKVAWVNERADDYCHRITCLAVFGSWLTDKPHLGDLDVGVTLDELPGCLEIKPEEAMHEWFVRTDAARNRVLRALRLRQPKKISIHMLGEVIRLKTPFKVVFGALPK